MTGLGTGGTRQRVGVLSARSGGGGDHCVIDLSVRCDRSGALRAGGPVDDDPRRFGG